MGASRSKLMTHASNTLLAEIDSIRALDACCVCSFTWARCEPKIAVNSVRVSPTNRRVLWHDKNARQVLRKDITKEQLHANYPADAGKCLKHFFGLKVKRMNQPWPI